MFEKNQTIEFQGRQWTVVRAKPDSDGDIIIKGPDGIERYARENQCSSLVPTAVPSTTCETPSKPEPVKAPTQPKGNDVMSSINRTVVSVSLLDQDAGLKPELALVADLGEHVVENGNTDSLKQKLLMDPKLAVAAKLEAHNEKRGKETDLDILKRTGNKVKLQPVEIHELTWSIK